MPAKLRGFFASGYRYYVLHGGRGSAKSWSMAIYLVCQGYSSRHRILCCREIQKSIKDSVKKRLDDVVDSLGLRAFYRSTDTARTAPR